MCSLSQVLEPCVVNVMSKQQTDDALQTLINHYGSDKVVKNTEENLIEGEIVNEASVDKFICGKGLLLEWQGHLGMVKGTYWHLSLQDLCMRLMVKHKDAYPNLAKLAAVALCMQVTSVECERTFSTQNRDKKTSLGNCK